MSEIVLIRHGEPMRAGCYLGRGSDPPLSEKGRNDAASAVKLLEHDASMALYTSPLRRTRQTILPLARRLNLKPIVADGFAELDFGEWEGLDWKTIQERDPDSWRSWLDDPWQVAPPRGETLRELTHRVMQCLNTILRGNGYRRIVISTHGGPIRVILSQVLGFSPMEFWLPRVDYMSLFRFKFNGGSYPERNENDPTSLCICRP